MVRVVGERTPSRVADTDTSFTVRSGRLTIRTDTGDVLVREGCTYVVPSGRRHQLLAATEATVIVR